MSPKLFRRHDTPLLSESASMTMAERIAMFAPAGARPPAGPVVAATTSGTGPAAVADGDGALRVPAVSRRDTPVVRNVVRGGSAAA